jgi:hypothetical protein
VSEGKPTVDPIPAIDPIPVLIERGVRSAIDKSVAASLVGLVYLAKQASEEGRRRQCLEAINAILKIEPEHEEARVIQASVRAEMDRDFAEAQAMAGDARWKNDRELYTKAESLLRRVVEVDPDNLEAKALLLETVASSHSPSPVEDTVSSGSRMKPRSILIGSTAVVVLVAVLSLSKGIDSKVPPQKGTSGSTTTATTAPLNKVRALGQLDLVVEPTGAQMTLDDGPASPVPVSLELDPGLHRLVFNANGYLPETVSATVRAGDQHRLVVSLKAAQPETPYALRVESADRLLRADSFPPQAPAPRVRSAVAMGALAVNAAVPAEIYRGEEHLGSTPATLQLPAGTQTLEYRYQGHRQTLSHLIKSQETTIATVSFLSRVQINAKPWAQVSIAGSRLLGQTPIGDVDVPIGSILVFQNPGFPEKRYRVGASDAEIQVTFP